jgi:hypothetical protein
VAGRNGADAADPARNKVFRRLAHLDLGAGSSKVQEMKGLIVLMMIRKLEKSVSAFMTTAVV